MPRLGVNIDHVATVRQARREGHPDLVRFAGEAVRGGAQGITIHLREDRRHIQDADVFALREALSVPLNLEMAAVPDILAVAEQARPQWACLVPEKRAELTTEGGLDVGGQRAAIADAVRRLHAAGVRVSFFVDPSREAARAAKALGANAIEIHTGVFARLWRAVASASGERSGAGTEAKPLLLAQEQLIVETAQAARGAGLLVNAGHGLDLENAGRMADLFPFDEFNIGFALVSRALEVGMAAAVREMATVIGGVPCAGS